MNRLVRVGHDESKYDGSLVRIGWMDRVLKMFVLTDFRLNKRDFELVQT